MSKTRILTLMALLLSQYDNVRGKPLDNFLINNESNEDTKTLESNAHRNPRSHHTWMLPISAFSVSNTIKDNSGDISALKKRMETMQKNQEEMLKLLSKLTEASKAASCKSPSVPTSNNDHSNKEPEDSMHDKLKPAVVDILDIKTEIADKSSNIKSPSQDKIRYDDPGFDVNGTKLTQLDNETAVNLLKTDNSSIKLDVDENKSDEYNRYTTVAEFVPLVKNISSEQIEKQLTKSENDLKNEKESSKFSNSQDNGAEEIDERNVQPVIKENNNYMEKNFKGMSLTYVGNGSDS